MSEATLTKVQNDCAKLEAEIQMYKNSQSMTAACEAICTFIAAQKEPFSVNGSKEGPNPWLGNSKGEGGCSIS